MFENFRFVMKRDCQAGAWVSSDDFVERGEGIYLQAAECLRKGDEVFVDNRYKPSMISRLDHGD